jgi:DNA-binding beta-propeller fold protein YncE
VRKLKQLVRALQPVGLALGLLIVPALAQAEGPAFKIDPLWPKDMPNNWAMGQVGGISIDEQDHIWVLQRPRSLTAAEAAAAPPVKDAKPTSTICCRPAPSVLEFDQAGNLLAAWGGPVDVDLGQVDVYNGQTQPRPATTKLGYDWPATEHGILVAKGFVYLAGNGANDGMILKFTTDGKFVAEWGGVGPCTSSNDMTRFCQVADMDYDPATNEIYVADGYGNKRVAVVDADTGKIKRIWGAYGQNPIDDKSLPADNPKSANFGNPVHCITLAKNGMVYVCDRTNDRVQVFTKDGKFVKEYAFEPETLGPGSTWGITFSSQDPDQKYAIMTDGTNNQIVVWRVADGQIVGRFGRAGHNAGQFSWVHYAKTDSKGNLYSGEVDVGKRMQKWTPVP